MLQVGLGLGTAEDVVLSPFLLAAVHFLLVPFWALGIGGRGKLGYGGE